MSASQEFTLYLDPGQKIVHYIGACTGSSGVEQETLNLLVVGSNPPRCTRKYRLSGRYFLFCYTVHNMSMLFLIGLVMAGIPILLIVGFAAYIFLGFVNDDKDARAVLNVALVVMVIGFVLILADVVTRVFVVTK